MLYHRLINPNQVRSYGMDFGRKPYYKGSKMCIEVDDLLTIILKITGTKVYLNTSTSTVEYLK